MPRFIRWGDVLPKLTAWGALPPKPLKSLWNLTTSQLVQLAIAIILSWTTSLSVISCRFNSQTCPVYHCQCILNLLQRWSQRMNPVDYHMQSHLLNSTNSSIIRIMLNPKSSRQSRLCVTESAWQLLSCYPGVYTRAVTSIPATAKGSHQLCSASSSSNSLRVKIWLSIISAGVKAFCIHWRFTCGAREIEDNSHSYCSAFIA